MKILFTRNTIAGGESVSVGDTAEIPDIEARYLIAVKKAVEIDEEKIAKAKKFVEDVVDNRESDLKVEDRDPKPTKPKRGRPKKKDRG